MINHKQIFCNHYDLVPGEWFPCFGCGKTAIDVHHIKLKSQGYSTAIVDLTQGELSTNGDVKTRQKESELAAKILRRIIKTETM